MCISKRPKPFAKTLTDRTNKRLVGMINEERLKMINIDRRGHLKEIRVRLDSSECLKILEFGRRRRWEWFSIFSPADGSTLDRRL